MAENINFNLKEENTVDDASNCFAEELYGQSIPQEKPSMTPQEFATAISKQINAKGINALQDVMKKYGNSEAITAAIPQIDNQLSKDCKDITVTLNEDARLIKFTKTGKQAEEVTYSLEGTKYLEEKIGTDGKVTESTSFYVDGKTRLSCAQYRAGSYDLKSVVNYDKDGKSKLSEHIYKSTGRLGVQYTYMPDGKKIGEMNPDMDEDRLKVYVPGEGNAKKFSVSQYRAMLDNYRSGNYDQSTIKRDYELPLEIYKRLMEGVIVSPNL